MRALPPRGIEHIRSSYSNKLFTCKCKILRIGI